MLQVFIPYMSVHEMVMHELVSLLPDVVAAEECHSTADIWDTTPADKLGIPGEDSCHLASVTHCILIHITISCGNLQGRCLHALTHSGRISSLLGTEVKL